MDENNVFFTISHHMLIPIFSYERKINNKTFYANDKFYTSSLIDYSILLFPWYSRTCVHHRRFLFFKNVYKCERKCYCIIDLKDEA